MLNNIKNVSTTEQLLRFGVAFSFFYPAISAWFNPYSWIGYFPGLILDLAGDAGILLLHTFGIFEIIIGLWILFGKKIYIPSLVATVSLGLIIILNLSQMDVIFRDIPILFMAVILVLKHKQQTTS